jgi:hypothetical protein
LFLQTFQGIGDSLLTVAAKFHDDLISQIEDNLLFIQQNRQLPKFFQVVLSETVEEKEDICIDEKMYLGLVCCHIVKKAGV